MGFDLMIWFLIIAFLFTVEPQWLEHLWDHENLFEAGAVRANEGKE